MKGEIECCCTKKMVTSELGSNFSCAHIRVNHNQMAINYQNPVTHVYFQKSGWQGHFYVTKSSIQLGNCCASKKN